MMERVDRAKKYRKIFPKRLRSLRLSHNLTLMQMSRCIDIPASTLNAWERGTAFPKDDLSVNKIADFYSVERDFLYGC